MIKVYGSKMCHNTRDFRKNLDRLNIDYQFIDINLNLSNLKEFLLIRDTNKQFERIKEQNGIGIPTILDEDGNVITRWTKYLENLGYDIVLENEECIDDNMNC
jgi:glutaredoxin-related protein